MNLDGYVLNVFTNSFFTSPRWGRKYCSQRVCVFLCMYVGSHISETTTFPNFVKFLLAHLMGQYCFSRCSLLSVVVCNAAGAGRSAAIGLSAWAVGRLTLHGGPVRLRPIKATPCCTCYMWPWLSPPLMSISSCSQ